MQEQICSIGQQAMKRKWGLNIQDELLEAGNNLVFHLRINSENSIEWFADGTAV